MASGTEEMMSQPVGLWNHYDAHEPEQSDAAHEAEEKDEVRSEISVLVDLWHEIGSPDVNEVPRREGNDKRDVELRLLAVRAQEERRIARD